MSDEGNGDRTEKRTAQHEPFERRSTGVDGAAVADPEYRGPERRAQQARPSERRRWRQLLNRWKEPIIGLTVAGAAAPLIHSGMRSPTDRPPKAVEGDSEGQPGYSAATQDAVAEQWREAAEARMRELTIAGAVARYDISHELARRIFDKAVAERIEPDLAYGLVRTESTFRSNAVSNVGARGLTQLLPRTARWILGTKRTPNLFDVDTNLTVGFRYLRKLIDDYHGNIRLALTAYNRGPGTVNRILRRGGDPDNGYAARVLDE